MSAMTRFTLRSLATSRVRTLVTIAGVALAAALLTAVLTSYASLEGFLYRGEVAANGHWTAEVRVEDADAAMPAATAESVRAMATLTDVGFAANDETAARRYGAYLPVLAAEGPVGEVCGIEPSEGRLPQAADEIMLPEGYRDVLATEGKSCEIGDELELSLGQREVVVAGGEDVEGSLGRFRSDAYSELTMLKDGMRLDSDAALVSDDSSPDGTTSERLVDVQLHRFVVVGFYDKANLATVTSFGTVAFCGPDPQAQGTVAAYMVMDGVSSVAQLEERLSEMFPGVKPYLHSNLLRSMGTRSDAGIWDTFYAMVGILALVIVVACVSLIYNAFAISVAERTRQFGLLASIGASKRQLRRSVLLEALVVAVIGVPLGIALGIGGTGIVLSVLGPSLSQVFGDAQSFDLVVSPAALAFAAALALVSVLASAWMPARRASRASAVDALRRAVDIRMPKRGARAASRASAVRQPWRRRGIGGRIFGIGGQIASINAARGAARGRTASLSLALAVVLLMTAGSLTTYLSVLANAAGKGAGDCDVTVSAFNTKEDPAPSEDVVAGFEEVYDRLCGVPGVDPQGFAVIQSATLLVPEAMAGSSLEDEALGMAVEQQPGSYAVPTTVVGLSDGAFRDYAAACGADPDAFLDPGCPRAIAMATAYGNDGLSYLYRQVFDSPGETQVLTGATYGGEPVQGVSLAGVSGEGEAAELDLMAAVLDDDRLEGVPFEELDVTWSPLAVAAIAEEGPATRPSAYAPTVFVPAAMMGAWGLLSGPAPEPPSFSAWFDADDHEEASIALEDAADQAMAALPAQEESMIMVTDHQADMDNVRALILVVNVFCLLFTVILTLIAMANVFNTVANGLILRRREFAVMKSVGMGNRAFRSMVAAECVRFSVRGLVPGLAVAVLVSFGLYQAIALSMCGLEFVLPWGYMALSVALVLAALALSVAYGLHRCKASNVVEALRDIA